MKLLAINSLQTHLTIKEINPQAIPIIMTAFGREMKDQVHETLDTLVMLKLANVISGRI